MIERLNFGVICLLVISFPGAKKENIIAHHLSTLSPSTLPPRKAWSSSAQSSKRVSTGRIRVKSSCEQSHLCRTKEDAVRVARLWHSRRCPLCPWHGYGRSYAVEPTSILILRAYLFFVWPLSPHQHGPPTWTALRSETAHTNCGLQPVGEAPSSI